VRRFIVEDWQYRDLLDTGDINAVGLRPQRIAAAEPYCKRCNRKAWPTRTLGRWDWTRRATAIPLDIVFVEMSCGCTFGDEQLARPAADGGAA
jgi:hypothetical protein